MLKYKNVLLFALGLILIVLCMWSFRDFFSSEIRRDYADDTATLELVEAKNTIFEQYIDIDYDMTSLDVYMLNESDRDAMVTASLYRNEGLEKVALYAQATEQVHPNGGAFTVVTFPLEFKKDEASSSACLVLELAEGSDVKYVTTCGTYDIPLFVDHELKGARLRMTVHYGKKFYPEFMLCVFGVAFVALLIFCVSSRKFRTEHMFLALALTSGIAFAVIGPALQECDGLDHFVRSMDVSYGNVLGSFVNLTHDDEQIKLPQNIGELNYRLIGPYSGEAAAYMEHLRGTEFSEAAEVSWYQHTVTSVYYWPQGLGIWLGRICGASMYTCILLSRLFNLAFYILITFFAIRLMPMYKNLLAFIATLPITLYQAASDSPDALLNAFCFLFIALCFSYTFDSKKRLNWKHAFGLGVLLAVIFMCKYVYVCVGLLVFMIPKDKFETRKQYWISFAVALLPLVLLGGNMLLVMLNTLGKTQATAGEMTQLQYIMAHPLQPIKVLGMTFVHYARYYMEWLNYLGSMNYDLGVLVPVVPCLIAVVGCLDVPMGMRPLHMKHRMLSLFAAVLVICGVSLALYIGDGTINPVGSAVILGVQGRYFIPVMLLPFVALGSGRIQNNISNFSKKVMGMSALVLLYAVVELMWQCY